MLAACSSKEPDGRPGAAADERNAKAACERAAALRARVPGWRAEGKLDRARRAMLRAEAACPASAPASWSELLDLHAELGAYREGLSLAEKVERASDAPAAAKQAAAALRKAAAAPAPDGEALIEAGLKALAAGNAVEAQRALDRGRIALEQQKGKRMSVTAGGTLEGTVTGTAWREDGSALAVAHGRFVTVVPMDPALPTSTFREHTTRVRDVRWLHEGRLASADGGGALLIWSARNGAVEKRLTAGPGELRIEVSADDKRVAVGGGDDRRLRVFRVEDGAKTMDVEQDGTSLIGFVPGRDEMWSDAPPGLSWWDLTTGKAVHEAGVGDSPRAVAPNGRDVAVIQNEHDLVIRRDYAAAEGPVIAKAPSCQAHMFPTGFTPDGKTLVIHRLDGTKMGLALPGGRPLWKRDGIAEGATVSRDATLLAQPGAGGSILVQDTRTGQKRAALTGGRGARQLEFSPDGKRIMALEGRSGLSIWSLDRAEPQRTLGHDQGGVGALQGSAERLVVVRERTLSTLRLADAAAWSTSVKTGRATVDPTGARAAVDEGEEVKLWDLQAQKLQTSIAAKTHHRLLPSADGAAVGAEQGYAFSLVSGPGGPPDRPIPALGHRSTLTRDGKLVIGVTDNDGRVGVWEVATGKQKCLLGSPATKTEPWPEEVPASRDGGYLVALFKDEIRLYPGCSPAPKYTAPTGWTGRPAGTSALSDDGEHLYFLADIGDKLHVWELAKGTHTEHKDPRFKHISVGPNGDVLLWSPEDAVLWRSPDSPVTPLSVAGVEAVEWSRGRLLLGTEDGAVIIVAPREGKVVGKVQVLGAAASITTAGPGLYEVFGDPGAALGCELAGKVYPIDVCREGLSSKGLLGRLLAGEEAEADP